MRGHSDFLSTKHWLPEEVMQLILEYTFADSESERAANKAQSLPLSDDLLAKVWTLREILLGTVSLERVNQAVGFLLANPPTEGTTGQVWGLEESFDWLAQNCESSELSDYDEIKAKHSAGVAANVSDSEDDNDNTSAPQKRDSSDNDTDSAARAAVQDDDIEVSDIESDLEPDELLHVYLRTKARLYEIDPSSDDVKPKKKSGRTDAAGFSKPPKVVQRLQNKLDRIGRDVLFDQREADMQWAAMRIELAKAVSQRKQLGLTTAQRGNVAVDFGSAEATNGTNSKDVMNQAERDGEALVNAANDLNDDILIGGIFDSLPGVTGDAADAQKGVDQNSGVTIRDFGRLTGMSPRRILEEACRARDPRCSISYKQVSPTTYSCRYCVTVRWNKEQQVGDITYLPSVTTRTKSLQTTVTMMTEATPDPAQSEAYVATAALFVIFSGSPKEEKAHLRLPPAFRNLWDEFSELKQNYSDAKDRRIVKELQDLLEKHKFSAGDEDDEDEVIFRANHRRLNGAASGASTPSTRPQTPTPKTTDSSQFLRDLWRRKVTTPSYQDMLLARMNLPMYHARAEALQTIEKHQVSIVVGDTGSGKSTQLPQFLLEHELSQGRHCKIYCTEPRRISALSLAQRVSDELGENKGDLGTHRSLVGYAIRLESRTSPSTKLVFATVGVVLRMLENESGLPDITHLVLDEVHERSIDTDFLLIVLKSLMEKRPDLKVILMSATVDANKFAHYFDNAPIISVPGRTYPVQSYFLEDAIESTGHTNDNESMEQVVEQDGDDSEGGTDKPESRRVTGYSSKTVTTLANYDEYKVDIPLIVKLLEHVSQNPNYQAFSKAMLVFLPGIAEIRQLNDALLGHKSFSRDWRIHALHSTFSSEDQQAAFDIPPPGVRKIVIATNIAETGITIPDITCVIDTGKHREMRFDERRQMSRLTQSFIARANAKQRRGRAGRVQEGICFHLFTKYRFENLMAEQQSPEMLRLSLQDLVMRVKICKLGDIEETLGQALDPPSSKNVRRAIDALIEVGALTDNVQLTPLGNQLAKLPLDAQLGKLILFGAAFGCLDFTLTVAAALTSKSPFLSPMHAKKQADSVRLGFKRGDSDLLTLYNAYSAWRKICNTTGMSERHFCNKNFLSSQNLSNIEDLKAQLLTSLVDSGFVQLTPTEKTALMRVKPGYRQRHFVSLPEKYCTADTDDELCTSVVAWSFYPKIAKSEGKGWRNIANNATLGLHPTSVNKLSPSSDIKYLSFYSIMQSSSRWTNAQETSPVSDFALVLLAGDAVFHMYAGVIVVDGNRLRFKIRDWKTMIALKILRARLKEAMGRMFKHPGRELGAKQRRWVDLLIKIFEQRRPSS